VPTVGANRQSLRLARSPGRATLPAATGICTLPVPRWPSACHGTWPRARVKAHRIRRSVC